MPADRRKQIQELYEAANRASAGKVRPRCRTRAGQPYAVLRGEVQLLLSGEGSETATQALMKLPRPRRMRPRFGHLICEKSAASMYTDSGGLARILPFASDSAATFFHSGSSPNSFQFFTACSRLEWATM
jgi:hypothetical protein